MKKNMIGALLCLFVLNSTNAQDPDLYFRDQQLKKQANEPGKVNWPIDSITKGIEFKSIIQVENTNAQILFSRAKSFVAKNFISGKDATQLVDEYSKSIIGKGVLNLNFSDVLASANGELKFTFQIECKDNRFRYTFKIGDARRTFPDGTGTYWANFLDEKKPSWVIKSVWLKMQNDAYRNITILIYALNKEMISKSDEF